MDWSRCPDVERKPGVLSGADVIVGTLVPPETILDSSMTATPPSRSWSSFQRFPSLVPRG